MTYDVALTNSNGVIRVALPMPLSRALLEGGYNRAALEITDAGLVIKPYIGKKNRNVVELPGWDSDAVQE